MTHAKRPQHQQPFVHVLIGYNRSLARNLLINRQSVLAVSIICRMKPNMNQQVKFAVTLIGKVFSSPP